MRWLNSINILNVHVEDILFFCSPPTPSFSTSSTRNPKRATSKLSAVVNNREVESDVERELLKTLSNMRHNQPTNKHAQTIEEGKASCLGLLHQLFISSKGSCCHCHCQQQQQQAAQEGYEGTNLWLRHLSLGTPASPATVDQVHVSNLCTYIICEGSGYTVRTNQQKKIKLTGLSSVMDVEFTRLKVLYARLGADTKIFPFLVRIPTFWNHLVGRVSSFCSFPVMTAYE